MPDRALRAPLICPGVCEESRLVVENRLDLFWLHSMCVLLRFIERVPNEVANLNFDALHDSNCTTKIVLPKCRFERLALMLVGVGGYEH